MNALGRLFAWSWWTASVNRRIGLMMLMTVVLTAAVAAISLRGLATLSLQLDNTVAYQSTATGLVGRMLDESRRLSESAHRAVSAATPEERDAALADLEASKKLLGERVEQISAQLAAAPELQNALREGFSSFVISAVKASRLLQAGRQQDAERVVLEDFDPKLLSYVLMTISGISQHTERSVENVAASGHSAYNRTIGLLLPLLIAVAAVVIVGQFLLHWTVIKPVRRVARAAEQLAAGCFDIDLATRSNDECGEMLRAMAALREQLSSMVAAMQAASQTVVTTADELANSNQELSSRTGDQARALRAAAAALESLNQMAGRSADSVRRIDGDMQSALDAAQRGNDVIAQVVSTVSETAVASRKIADTVGMIHEIAFKTNMLSLNAAIEAARAGEQGRGFAVVAAEVRMLAGKSAVAAKEIETLIAENVRMVEKGAKLGNEAGLAIEDIVRQVRAAAGGMTTISDSSDEQSRRADELTSTIGEIDANTQRNASMVSAAAAATETLRNEAHGLTAKIAEFTASKAEPAMPRPVAAMEGRNEAAASDEHSPLALTA